MNKKFIIIVAITLFSVILWGFITLSEDFFASVSVPVKFTNLPDGYAIGEVSTESAELNLKGEGWLLAKLIYGAKNELEISVEGKTGKQSLSIMNSLAQNSWLSSKLAVNWVKPGIVNISVQKIIRKKVFIKPAVDLHLKPGFEIVSEIEFFPDTITITGPESIVNRLDTISTEVLTMESVDEEVEELVNLRKLKRISFPNRAVNIKVDVQKIVDKTFEGIKVDVSNLSKGFELIVMPQKVDISLRGGIKVLAKITNDDLRASVNFVDALKDTLGAISPNVSYPGNTRLLEIKPSKLEYIIKQY